MTLLLTCLTWARTVPAKVWLGVVAVLLAAGWLRAHDAEVRQQALDARAMREANHARDLWRDSANKVTVAREQDSARASRTVDSLEAKAAFTLQRIVQFTPHPVPQPSVIPGTDSVTFSRSVWEGHVADDAKRDSGYADLAAIARDGIPAIRNQYEAVLAKDVKLFALKDSLIANAEARAKLATHPTSHWHAVLGPCYAVGPTGHHGVALCAAVGWSPF